MVTIAAPDPPATADAGHRCLSPPGAPAGGRDRTTSVGHSPPASARGLDPKHAPAHFNLGNALAAKKDPDGAIAAYKEAIRLDPKYANAHANLGLDLHAKQDVGGAIAAYTEAVRLS
jgi:tetratricopeptide (TPR) repeat protein